MASADPRTTVPVRISYPAVFKPRGFQDSDPKYSVTLMFDKTNKEQMASLKVLFDDATAVLNEAWPNKETQPRIPMMGSDNSPIKDCDKACDRQGIPLAEKNPPYVGHYIIRCATGADSPPFRVDRNVEEIIDASVIYPGCFCKVNLNAYSYEVKGPTGAIINKGVTFGFNGIQFVKDGDRIGGTRKSVDQMFEAEDPGADDPANYAQDDPFGGSAPTDETDPFA